MNVLRYIAARLKEPSTHAGIAALLVFLATVDPQRRVLWGALSVLFGGVAAATPDATSTATDAPAPALAAEAEASKPSA